MEPQFPLRTPPACLTCGQPCSREIVQANNPNGNAGRWFYTCKNGEHGRELSCFDDRQGIANGNPQCWCGFTSRRVRNKGPTESYFYSCPAGSCRYTRDAPLVPEANTPAVVGTPPRYAESRPKVDVETHVFGTSPGYSRPCCYCCVVM